MAKANNEKIRVLLVDDHQILRDGIKSHLSTFDHVFIVGEASDGAEAIAKAKELIPDIVVMDISLPDMNGLTVTKEVLQALPDTKVIILSMHDDRHYVLQSVQAGARGYLLKDTCPTDLLSAIELVHKGGAFFDPSVSRYLFDQQGDDEGNGVQEDVELSSREREVLALVAEGFSNKEVASKLFLSVRTIETHRENIMRKLDIHGTAALTKYAIQKGIIEVK
ncbi:response regulator transcription factor [bacterium]|nr:response regulator transcription factor [bacterium]